MNLNNSPLFSVIVPVYKVEKYLHQIQERGAAAGLQISFSEELAEKLAEKQDESP